MFNSLLEKFDFYLDEKYELVVDDDTLDASIPRDKHMAYLRDVALSLGIDVEYLTHFYEW